MSVTVMAVIFVGLTLGLMAIPFLPGLIEWKKRTDSEPLRVIRGAEVDIRHFEKRFRSYLEANLKDVIKTSRSTGRAMNGVLADDTGYLVVPDEQWTPESNPASTARSTERMIIACGHLQLPPRTTYPVEIYCGGSVQGGDKNIYRAILAERRIRLGVDSISLRWLHAGEVVHARAGCILYGRVSADSAILLSEGCRFERLSAPLLEFGQAPEPVDQPEQSWGDHRVLKARDIPRLVEDEAGRWLIEKKLELADRKKIEANLVVTGWARFGEYSRIVGSIKTRQDLRLGKGVEVDGAVVSEKNIFIGEGCRIKGPVLAEGNVYIERRTMIGSTAVPTTISADGIFIVSGATLYGTVWAHGAGRVCSWDEMSKLLKHAGRDLTK
jgi:hypothetical protein